MAGSGQAFAFISRPIFSVVTKRQIPSYENAPKTVVIVRIFLIQFDFSSLTSPKVWKEGRRRLWLEKLKQLNCLAISGEK